MIIFKNIDFSNYFFLLLIHIKMERLMSPIPRKEPIAIPITCGVGITYDEVICCGIHDSNESCIIVFQP